MINVIVIVVIVNFITLSRSGLFRDKEETYINENINKYIIEITVSK